MIFQRFNVGLRDLSHSEIRSSEQSSTCVISKCLSEIRRNAPHIRSRTFSSYLTHLEMIILEPRSIYVFKKFIYLIHFSSRNTKIFLVNCRNIAYKICLNYIYFLINNFYFEFKTKYFKLSWRVSTESDR